jgi:hypothetical protein
MITYTASETKPEGFTSAINESGKVYCFHIFTNYEAVKYQAKYGNLSPIKILVDQASQNSNELLIDLAYWLLDDKHREEFPTLDSFAKASVPYYLRKNDFDSKLLKCLAICLVKKNSKDKGGATADAARFQGSAGRGGPGKTSAGSWLERIRLLVFKPATNTNKS